MGRTVAASEDLKPLLRGVFHQWAFFAALVAVGILVGFAGSATARAAAIVYGVALAAMFGASALYHRINWSERPRRWMRRLDHSAIFLLIAGTYTPFCLLVLSEPLGVIVLAVVWGGAFAAGVINFAWIDAPKWATAAVGIALGWISVIALPQMPGVEAILLAIGGDLLHGRARSPTRCGARTRSRACSATTRSSTCSWWRPPRSSSPRSPSPSQDSRLPAVGYSISNLDELGEGYGFRKVRVPLGVTAFGVNGVVMPPGFVGFLHYHDEQDELYFVHRGTARVEVDGAGARARRGRPDPRRGDHAAADLERERDGRPRPPGRRRQGRLHRAGRPPGRPRRRPAPRLVRQLATL